MLCFALNQERAKMKDILEWLPPQTPATIRKGSALSEPMAGGEGRDILFGKSGADLLIGDPDDTVGGLRDILVGGRGPDTFYFQSIPEHGRDADVILDLKPGKDAIFLDFDFLPGTNGKGYGYKPEHLDKDSLTYGKQAKDADDFVIYRKKTGALLIDTDGNGPDAAHKIAILANKAKIDATDIHL